MPEALLARAPAARFLPATGVEPALAFSICTLVNDRAQHAAMVASFQAGGFGPKLAEFLALDTTEGQGCDAFQGIPRLLAAARGRYVVLCHQDVRLLSDGAAVLLARLAELDRLDPGWALAGNAGATPEGELAIRISDPYGEDQRRGRLPARAVSLDENFLVLRRAAPVGLSADLAGFHLYGADLCLQARLAGRSAWVIDFHLRHLSPGRKDASFHAAQTAFEAKYAALLAGLRGMRTTCTQLDLRRSRLGRWLWRRKRGLG
ncbi:acyl esterase [Siccirubricoccus phaeus]|uniref:acyl esterase n=1 Tax=Siccirubricoccus phaeus TaxID=2595053 RepID=UPI0011F2BF4D|nr:acyl esterase [Siccirubricoccus phaeus]